MTYPINLDHLGVRFGAVDALTDITLAIPGGAIVGLLGRNGAGKTTMLSIIASFRRPSSGTVTVAGENPFEHARLMSDICLIREAGTLDQGTTVAEYLEVAELLRPRWDPALADRLIDRFEIPRSTKAGQLSLGKRSALAVVIGLATRAPVTMFDEAHLGMDVPTRYAFYEELLADYAEHPRTVLLSTHLIDEVASLFERVIILDRGRLLLHESIEELQGRGAEITGPADAVAAVTAGMPVLSTRQLGPTLAVVVDARLDRDARAAVQGAGLDVAPMPLQDLFVHLTAEEVSS